MYRRANAERGINCCPVGDHDSLVKEPVAEKHDERGDQNADDQPKPIRSGHW
jgi:hypothetical protein